MLNNSNMGIWGHDYTLKQKRINKQVCKNYFSNRVAKLWNKWPEPVIRFESLNIKYICVASLQKGPHVAVYQSRENRS